MQGRTTTLPAAPVLQTSLHWACPQTRYCHAPVPYSHPAAPRPLPPSAPAAAGQQQQGSNSMAAPGRRQQSRSSRAAAGRQQQGSGSRVRAAAAAAGTKKLRAAPAAPTWRLSAENATDSTSLVWPTKRRVVVPLLMSQRRSVPSHEPERQNWPSEEITTSWGEGGKNGGGQEEQRGRGVLVSGGGRVEPAAGRRRLPVPVGGRPGEGKGWGGCPMVGPVRVGHPAPVLAAAAWPPPNQAAISTHDSCVCATGTTSSSKLAAAEGQPGGQRSPAHSGSGRAGPAWHSHSCPPRGSAPTP